MYLPDEVWRELDVRFDELNAKHKRQHGEALEKNRDYYPAIIQAGLNDKDLEEILDL
ncbi:HNH endonuclease [Halorhabdus sp. CBA1104]|nr:HNH endonuclease [Halorhabdus sp. CBA1104]